MKLKLKNDAQCKSYNSINYNQYETDKLLKYRYDGIVIIMIALFTIVLLNSMFLDKETTR